MYFIFQFRDAATSNDLYIRTLNDTYATDHVKALRHREKDWQYGLHMGRINPFQRAFAVELVFRLMRALPISTDTAFLAVAIMDQWVPIDYLSSRDNSYH